MGSRVKPTRILCVNCSICVNKLRRRYPALAQDSRVTAIICSWVYPQIVLEEDVICEACRDLAMAAVNSSLQSEVSGSDVAGPSTRRQTNACLLCGSSILNRRSDKILRENPNEMQQSIIDLITSKLAPPTMTTPSQQENMVSGYLPPLPPMNCEGNLGENFKDWIQRKNLVIQRNEFFSIAQNGMDLPDYFQKVINLGLTCELGELRESLTVSKIIAGLDASLNGLKTKLLAEDDNKLSLEYTMKYLLSAEASRKYVEEQQKPASQDSNEILYINKKKVFSKNNVKMINGCRNCGTSHEINKCPAFKQTCYKCGMSNHFSKVCRKSQKMKNNEHVNLVQESSLKQNSTEDLFVGTAAIGNEISQMFMVRNQLLPVKIDTGAACNVIGKQVCDKLGIRNSEINRCNKKVVQLDGKCVPVCGTCQLEVIHPNKNKYNIKFIILQGNIPTLIGCKTCLECNFISVNTDLVNIHSITCNNINELEYIKRLKTNFSKLFDGGLGCIPGQVSIQLTEDAIPVFTYNVVTFCEQLGTKQFLADIDNKS
ncbi:hypothetical protein ACJJTC_019311 [Scirpophaga incertulas]